MQDLQPFVSAIGIFYYLVGPDSLPCQPVLTDFQNQETKLFLVPNSQHNGNNKFCLKTRALHKSQKKACVAGHTLYCNYSFIVDSRIFKATALWAMLSISQNSRVSVCLSVYMFTFEVSFKHLFNPTSQSQMSNTFRDSESLRKSYEKKWSHI